jgi:hypothetical protein
MYIALDCFLCRGRYEEEGGHGGSPRTVRNGAIYYEM